MLTRHLHGTARSDPRSLCLSCFCVRLFSLTVPWRQSISTETARPEKKAAVSQVSRQNEAKTNPGQTEKKAKKKGGVRAIPPRSTISRIVHDTVSKALQAAATAKQGPSIINPAPKQRSSDKAQASSTGGEARTSSHHVSGRPEKKSARARIELEQAGKLAPQAGSTDPETEILSILQKANVPDEGGPLKGESFSAKVKLQKIEFAPKALSVRLRRVKYNKKADSSTTSGKSRRRNLPREVESTATGGKSLKPEAVRTSEASTSIITPRRVISKRRAASPIVLVRRKGSSARRQDSAPVQRDESVKQSEAAKLSDDIEVLSAKSLNIQCEPHGPCCQTVRGAANPHSDFCGWSATCTRSIVRA